jgi:hypothetical protein
MMLNRDDPKSWGCFRPLIIAHDVGRSRDRSTAVVGGLAPFDPNLIGIQDAHELRQGAFGSARASELAVSTASMTPRLSSLQISATIPPMLRCCTRRLARALLAFKSVAMGMA